jgi:hypothetical protein
MIARLDSLGTPKAIAIVYKVVGKEQRDSFINLPGLEAPGALAGYEAVNIAAQSASPTTAVISAPSATTTTPFSLHHHVMRLS